jgi:protein gp37
VAKLSTIGWTHGTQNFWLGCDKIAPECARCYIWRTLIRQGRQSWGHMYRTKTWDAPRVWQRQAERDGCCYRIFTCSLSDFFHVKADGWRAEAWDIIRTTPNLVWLTLTKRPELIAHRLPADWPDAYPNVWLGVSTGCRQTLNKMDSLRRIPIHPKAVRFLSAEPLLEDIAPYVDLSGFGWVIVGGESGGGPEYLWNPQGDWRSEFKEKGRRIMQLDWARHILDNARAANIPFYFKQVTALQPGQREDALGRKYQEYPPPPHSKWADKPGKADDRLYSITVAE